MLTLWLVTVVMLKAQANPVPPFIRSRLVPLRGVVALQP